MSSMTWTQRFGLSDFEVRDLRSAAGDPLRGALLSGRVSQSEYLEWAMRTHEIPRVKSEFFKIPVDPVFYAAVRNEYKWNASFVPLAEWNGVLLIGCLEPPNFHFRTNFTARFVLATAAELTERFEILEPDQKTTFVPPTLVTAPAPSATIPLPPPKPVMTPVADDVQTPPPPAAKPTRAPVVANVATAPVVVEKSVESTEPSLAELLAKPDIELPAAPDVSLAEPDGIVTIPKQASNERMIVPDGISVSEIDLSVEVTAKTAGQDSPDGLSEKTFVTSAKIDFGQLTAASQPDATRNEPPRLVKPTEVPATQQAPDEVTNVPKAATVPQQTITQPMQQIATSTGTVSIAPYPPTVPKPPVQPVDLKSVAGGKTSVVRNDVDVIPLADCKNYDQLAGSTLGRVLKTFDTSMILLFQNGQLMPWKWTEMLHSVKGDTPDPIDLTDASIFRIVFRTCLPYHGYVVACPVNTAFFNSFNRGAPPKHATIMPVLLNRKVAGMVLGLSNKEVDLRKTLGEMEIIAADFGTHLERVKSQKKAA